MAKNTKTDFLIPDSTRLAQYNPVFTVEDVTTNLSDKYKAFGREIRNIIQTLLRQNISTQDQTNFRLANKFLLEEWNILNKFIDDESFSPDMNILVAEETDNAIKELGSELDLSRVKIADLKNAIIKLFESETSKIKDYGEKIASELKENFEKQETPERKNFITDTLVRSKVGSSSVTFSSFDGLRYFTGWLTGAFTNVFVLTQKDVFNNINQSIVNIQSLAVKETENALKMIKNVKTTENIIEPKLTSSQSLAKKINSIANVISVITDTKELRRRTVNGIVNGYQFVVNGFVTSIHTLGEQIKSLGLAAAQNTYNAITKTLKKIGSMFKWSIGRVLSSSITWGIAIWLLWKYWLKDRFGDTIVKWTDEFLMKLKKWFGFNSGGDSENPNKGFINNLIGSAINTVKKTLYESQLGKFVVWFDKTWGKRLENVKEFLCVRIKKITDWAKNIIEKLKPVYDKARGFFDWYVAGWNFIVERIAKVLKKPYDRLIGGVKNLFQDVKNAGDWIWGLVTGKTDWKTAKAEFVENIWHPAIVTLHDTMREISNFVIIHGNWILDLLGVSNFTFGEPIDENGNRLEDPKTIFEQIANAITGWGIEKHTIQLADDASIVIEPFDKGKSGFAYGFDVQFILPNKTLETTLPGIKNATETLNELKESVDAFASIAIEAGGTLIGGFVGEWVGRAVGVLVSIIAAIGTGGVSLAGVGQAWDIGGAIGSILGSLIGYFFTRSLLNSRNYFESPVRESISEAMGVSEEAANTFDTSWTTRNARRMVGTNFSENNVSVTMNGREIKGEDDEDENVHALMPFDYTGLNKSDRNVFRNLGNFNQTVYNAFEHDFAVAMNKEGTEKDRELVDSILVKKNEKYFDKFDPNKAKSTERKFGTASLQTLIKQMMSDKTWYGDVAGLKDPIALYKQLTTTGNKWMDKILGFMFNEPSDPFTGKNLLEMLLFAASRNQMGSPNSGMFSQFDTPGVEYWGVTPIVRYILSARLGLAIFQYAVQKSLHTATSLFSNPTEGEAELMRGVNRLLLHHVFLRNGDDGYRQLANQISNEIFKKWFYKNGQSPNERLKTLYTRLLNFTKEADENKLQTMYSMGWNVRIKNILDTIGNYANLIVNNGGVKTGDGEDDFIKREDISKIFLTYPNIIGLFLSTGEIGEAFKNTNDGKPTKELNNEERMKQLANLFEFAGNSDLDLLNTEFTSMLNNFSEIVNMRGEDGEETRKKMKEMLDKVANSNWEEKIKGRIKSGLLSKKQYEELKKKFEELKDKLREKYMLGENTDESGNTVFLIYQRPESIGEKEMNELNDLTKNLLWDAR